MKEMLSEILEEHFLENYKPSWLSGLEIDRYYPSLRLAFEFQGDQHDRFHFLYYEEHASFLQQVKNDKKKKEVLCKKRIPLIEFRIQELTPSCFISKLSDFLFIPLEESKIATFSERVEKYIEGVSIYRNKTLKEFLSGFPPIDITTVSFQKDNMLTAEEKKLFLFLCQISKTEEVPLIFDDLQGLSWFQEEVFFALAKKNLLHFHYQHGLIAMDSASFQEVKQCILFQQQTC